MYTQLTHSTDQLIQNCSTFFFRISAN